MTHRIRLSLLLLGILVVLVLLVLLMFYSAARHVPEFYRKAMEIPPDKLEEGSDRMLQHAAALESAANKQGRWETLITADEINGWLAVDMVKNHPNALPPTFRDPRVTIDPNEITVACRFAEGGVNTVLSLTLAPTLPETNVIALRVVRARVGMLPVSLKKVLDRITDAGRSINLHLQWSHDGGDPVALISVPADKRRGLSMQIETLQLREGAIYIAGSTEKAGRK